MRRNSTFRHQVGGPTAKSSGPGAASFTACKIRRKSPSAGRMFVQRRAGLLQRMSASETWADDGGMVMRQRTRRGVEALLILQDLCFFLAPRRARLWQREGGRCKYSSTLCKCTIRSERVKGSARRKPRYPLDGWESAARRARRCLPNSAPSKVKSARKYPYTGKWCERITISVNPELYLPNLSVLAWVEAIMMM